MKKAKNRSFRPSRDRIYYTQAIYGQEEIAAVINSLKSGWQGPGKIYDY